MRGELVEELRHQRAVEIDVVLIELSVDALRRERRLEIVGEKPQLRMRTEVVTFTGWLEGGGVGAGCAKAEAPVRASKQRITRRCDVSFI